MTSCLTILIAVGFLASLLHVWRRFEYWYAKRKRVGWSVERFRAQIPDLDDDAMIRAAYHYLQEIEGHGDFPVSATDALGGGYFGLVDEDLWEAVQELATRCGRLEPPSRAAATVETVADMVRLVAAQPLLGEKTAASPN